MVYSLLEDPRRGARVSTDVLWWLGVFLSLSILALIFWLFKE
jgi:hypothetical protein